MTSYCASCFIIYFDEQSIMPPDLVGYPFESSMFCVGLGFKVMEGQRFSAGGGSLSKPNGICKKLWGRLAEVSGQGSEG